MDKQLNSEQPNTIENKFNKLIIIVSIAIPVVVAILFGIKLKDFGINVEPLTFLPPIYAVINGVTAMLLILGVYSIKNGNKKAHQNFMQSAIACSVVFLVMYVAYHMTSDSAVYGGVGFIRYFYFFILISHIIL